MAFVNIMRIVAHKLFSGHHLTSVRRFPIYDFRSTIYIFPPSAIYDSRFTIYYFSHETNRIPTNRVGSRGGAFTPRARADARRQVRLEAAREVDDSRLSGKHGGDNPNLDRHGDYAG